MTSPFRCDKTELLRRVLNRYDVQLRPRLGWQPVSCINRGWHARGDKNPSASAHLGYGRYTCHACGLHGDGFQLMLELENMQAKEVLKVLGFSADNVEQKEQFII